MVRKDIILLIAVMLVTAVTLRGQDINEAYKAAIKEKIALQDSVESLTTSIQRLMAQTGEINTQKKELKRQLSRLQKEDSIAVERYESAGIDARMKKIDSLASLLNRERAAVAEYKKRADALVGVAAQKTTERNRLTEKRTQVAQELEKQYSPLLRDSLSPAAIEKAKKAVEELRQYSDSEEVRELIGRINEYQQSAELYQHMQELLEAPYVAVSAQEAITMAMTLQTKLAPIPAAQLQKRATMLREYPRGVETLENFFNEFDMRRQRKGDSYSVSNVESDWERALQKEGMQELLTRYVTPIPYLEKRFREVRKELQQNPKMKLQI